MHHDHPPAARPATPLVPRAVRGRRPAAAAIVLAMVAWGLTGLYTVQPNEQAVVQRMGRMLPELRGPGLHLGLPIGLDRVRRVRLQELRRVPIGPLSAVRDAGRPGAALEHLTGDRNLVRLAGVVQYRIEDPRAFLFRAAVLEAMLGDLAAAALGREVAVMDVDRLLTVARPELQEALRARTQQAADALGLGVRVVAVTMEEIAPPPEVADAFRDVAAAREDRQRAINEAEGYASRLLPRARGEAGQILAAARGEAGDRVLRARGEAAAFLAMWERYRVDPSATALRLAIEAAEEVLPRLRMIVLDERARRRVDLVLPEAVER
ncbi:MAG: FtsH protease activity modulator HflK [Kiritimatiellae bacterium]|nr:FtsH protease activity modulator HflK [Kiritimatiellia bacterium]